MMWFDYHFPIELFLIKLFVFYILYGWLCQIVALFIPTTHNIFGWVGGMCQTPIEYKKDPTKTVKMGHLLVFFLILVSVWVKMTICSGKQIIPQKFNIFKYSNAHE